MSHQLFAAPLVLVGGSVSSSQDGKFLSYLCFVFFLRKIPQQLIDRNF